MKCNSSYKYLIMCVLINILNVIKLELLYNTTSIFRIFYNYALTNFSSYLSHSIHNNYLIIILQSFVFK